MVGSEIELGFWCPFYELGFSEKQSIFKEVDDVCIVSWMDADTKWWDLSMRRRHS